MYHWLFVKLRASEAEIGTPLVSGLDGFGDRGVANLMTISELAVTVECLAG